MAVFLTYYYPFMMAAVFLAALFTVEVPAKGRFFLRALTAFAIAIALAHVNRWFDLWPAHRYFASGHMTSSLGLALSLGMLRPWTLAVTLPLLVPFGMALVVLGFHTVGDVLGAIAIIALVYGAVHWWWRVPVASPSLDSGPISP